MQELESDLNQKRDLLLQRGNRHIDDQEESKQPDPINIEDVSLIVEDADFDQHSTNQ